MTAWNVTPPDADDAEDIRCPRCGEIGGYLIARVDGDGPAFYVCVCMRITQVGVGELHPGTKAVAERITKVGALHTQDMIDVVAAVRECLNSEGLTAEQRLAAVRSRLHVLAPEQEPEEEIETIYPPEHRNPTRSATREIPDGDPILCEHANEAPQRCPCSVGCYCKTRTCKDLQ